MNEKPTIIMKLKKRFAKYKARGVLVNVLFAVVFVLFMLYALSLIYPFIWAFLNSLKTMPEYMDSTTSLPSDPVWSNYSQAFTSLKVLKRNQIDATNFLGMFINSVWYTFGGSFLNIFASSMVAYCLSKYKFKGSGIIYATAIFVMIVPIVGSLPAMYKLIYQLHLDNSPLFLVTTFSCFGFSFIILYGAFKNISWSYAEAAFIDGASNWRVFLTIMLPQAKAAFISVFIIVSIDRWNDYQTPLLFLNDFATMSTGLFMMKYNGSIGGILPIYYAALLISMIPILLIYILFNNTIMNNMSAGGLKG